MGSSPQEASRWRLTTCSAPLVCCRPLITMARAHVAKSPLGWAEELKYSQSVVAGDLVFTAGQAAYGPDGSVVEGDTATQLRQCLENLRVALESAGASLKSVVKLNVYLVDPADYSAWQQVREEVLSPPWPAATAVSAALLADGLRCEIDAVAVRGSAILEAS